LLLRIPKFNSVSACYRNLPRRGTGESFVYRFYSLLLSIYTFLFIVLPPAQAQNLLVNGDFEAPIVTGSWHTYYSGADVGGWQVDKNSIDLVREYWVHAEGNQSVDLSGQDLDGAIYQDVTTVPGKRYNLRFLFAGNPAFQEWGTVKSMSVFWGPATGPLNEVGRFEFDVTGHSLTDLGWETREILNLQASSATMRLRFVSNTIPGVGPTLDNVVLEPIPPLNPDLDFNNDTKPDILWQNFSTGDVTCWLMNGVSILGYGSIASAIPTEWRIVATADIDGDRKPDFIWQNRTTGDITYWRMNGTTRLSSGYLARSIPTEWEIMAAPDLDGDSHFDLLWRNRVTGAVSYWIMNGTTASRYGIIIPSSDTKWQIVATLDINSDGHTDILWQHRTTGEVVYWVMNGTTWVSHATLVAGVTPEWNIAGRADLNGDGKMDLLWRSQSTGAVSYWLMNGTTRLSWGVIRNSVPLEWQIVGMR
jgi:choice-of-anchor C domain-containing protein